MIVFPVLIPGQNLRLLFPGTTGIPAHPWNTPTYPNFSFTLSKNHGKKPILNKQIFNKTFRLEVSTPHTLPPFGKFSKNSWSMVQEGFPYAKAFSDTACNPRYEHKCSEEPIGLQLLDLGHDCCSCGKMLHDQL